MDLPSEYRDALLMARKLHAEGRLLEAERIYRTLAVSGDYRFVALESLADLFWQQQRMDEAFSVLKALTKEFPDNLHYCAQLASRFEAVGQKQEAIDEYKRLLQRQPNFAVAHYNVALLYTQMKQYPQAIASYEKAIDLKIDRVEEVFSNIGVLYSDMEEPDNAKVMFERALAINTNYVPALFNLAGHYEETGDKQQAIDGYEQVLTLDAGHWKALARLAYPRKITSEHESLVERLERAIDAREGDKAAQESLYFALGKSLDDLGRYDHAATAYTAGNALGKSRSPAYDRANTESAFDQLIEFFDANWVRDNVTSSEDAPIFICGMFRSGSTLLEQMLGAHPLVTAGGEIEILPWLVGRELAPYPVGVRDASREKLEQVGNEYLERVGELFPGYKILTDKRPDNYLHIGLIKALFPRAKIISTRRGLLDNCLSLYFQQLGGNFSYSTDMVNCAHYIRQHDRLMEHWTSFLGEDIFVVNYEELVDSPEPLMRRLLDYIGVDWDDNVLRFQNTRSLVKTPSLWQVREKLHSRSSGRWRNYKTLVQSIKA